MSNIEKFKQLKKEINDLQAQAKVDMLEVFNEGIQEIFTKHGNYLRCIKSIQYTPYFNDGEPCEFNNYGFYVNCDDEFGHDLVDDIFTDEEIKTRYSFNHYDENKKWVNFPHPYYPLSEEEGAKYLAPQADVDEFIKIFSEDDFLELFGHDVEITITKDGIEIRDYDHE
jgi:hypothetical protein